LVVGGGSFTGWLLSLLLLVFISERSLLGGELIFYATFTQTNGVGSNVVAGAAPTIGVFRHATKVGGLAPDTLIPAITNNSLTYHPVMTNGTVYICYGAEGTKSIRRVRMTFCHNEVNGKGVSVSPLVHLVGNGEFVAAGDLFMHGGLSPALGTVAFDGHLYGYGTFTQPQVSDRNIFLVNELLITRLRATNVFEYWLDGTTIFGRVNNWQFSLPYTNAGRFSNITNLIVQFYAPAENATTARAPEIMELAAWNTPYPTELSLPGDAARLGQLVTGASGLVEFQVAGGANLTYVIEASADLIDWKPVATNVAVNGRIHFQDGEAAGHSSRFYRARSRP
jgi:hypothetical protein